MNERKRVRTEAELKALAASRGVAAYRYALRSASNCGRRRSGSCAWPWLRASCRQTA